MKAWTKGVVRIAINPDVPPPGKGDEVEAFCSENGRWAVFQPPWLGGWWNLTHRKAGGRIMIFRVRQRAEAAARRCDKYDDRIRWDRFKKPAARLDKRAREAWLELREELWGIGGVTP